ncbi:MAG: hypothetical protein K1X67_10420 [Fimbriimonadaceae bacterium]|nr:hypothetical protein [Fimbriimonadaceae bacterium]
MIETGRETEGGESPRPRPRKRAVRLTDDALAQLMNALYTRWKASGATGRLTREARAELLGVSVSTGDRIINQQGVDRHTLVLAFQSLTLEWGDGLCEYVVRPGDEEPEPPAATVDPAVPSPLTRSKRRMRWLLWPLAALFLVGANPVYQEVSFWYDSAYISSLAEDFNKSLNMATNEYFAGHYVVAEEEIGKALKLARRLGRAEMIALALRIEADIVAAQGSLSEARDLYAQALTIRESMRDARSRPALLEAIGDLETRIGDLKSAEIHLKEGLKGYSQQNDLGGITMCTRDLGTVAIEHGRLDEASRLFASALEVLAGKDPAMVKDIEARQALVLGERGQFAEAKEALQACLDFWVKKDHQRWIAKTRWQLATVEAASGDLRKALQSLALAREGYQRAGDRAGVADCERTLQELQRTQANYPGTLADKFR